MAPEWKIYLLSISYLSSIFVLRHKIGITFGNMKGNMKCLVMCNTFSIFCSLFSSSDLRFNTGSVFIMTRSVWVELSQHCFAHIHNLSIWSAATAPIIL